MEEQTKYEAKYEFSTTSKSIPTTSMSSTPVGMENKEQWLVERKKGIGGSDAPAVLGVSPWRTPLQVYLEKRGELNGSFDSPAMQWGRRLEPMVRQEYANQTGRQVVIPNTILRHPHYDWMLGNVDGIADGNRVLEIKTTRSADGWGEPGTDEIPDYYQVQVQHYMVVTGLVLADVAGLIGGSDFRLYEVNADPELQSMIVDWEAAFWESVKKGHEPDPRTAADIKIKFGKHSVARQVQATDEVVDAIRELREIAEMKKQEDTLKTIIQAHMKDGDTLCHGDKVLATWKQSKPPVRFDAKAFEENHPKLFQKYAKEGEPFRRFLLKK